MFIPFPPYLISYLHISTALFLPPSEIQANPERADGSQCLLEILSASYIFHSNAALREPVGGIQKSSLWCSDACPLVWSIADKEKEALPRSGMQQLLSSLRSELHFGRAFFSPLTTRCAGRTDSWSLEIFLCISITEDPSYLLLQMTIHLNFQVHSPTLAYLNPPLSFCYLHLAC